MSHIRNCSFDCYMTSELACSVVWIRCFPRPTFQPPQEVARYTHLPCCRTFVETEILYASNYFYSVLQPLLLPCTPIPPEGHRILHQDHNSESTSWNQDDFGRSGIPPFIEPKVKVKLETNMRKVLSCTISHWALYRISFGINRSWMVCFFVFHLTCSNILS